MKISTARVLSAALLCTTPASGLPAQSTPQVPEAWQQPVEPFRIAENLYYVGTGGLASYLITSGKQAILLDTSMEPNAPLLEDSIRKLGVAISDIKVILISHAHWDHVGALARIKQDTGATLAVMEEDVPAVQNGRPEGDNIYPATNFAPVHVDRTLHDGERVSLGNVSLRAIRTAGHTKGCTTWLMRTRDAVGELNLVFPCSISVAGNVLVDNHAYPKIAHDYRISFNKLRSLRADIVLPNHPEVANLMQRREKQLSGDAFAFRDTELLTRIVDQAEAAFVTALAGRPMPK